MTELKVCQECGRWEPMCEICNDGCPKWWVYGEGHAAICQGCYEGLPVAIKATRYPVLKEYTSAPDR